MNNLDNAVEVAQEGLFQDMLNGGILFGIINHTRRKLDVLKEAFKKGAVDGGNIESFNRHTPSYAAWEKKVAAMHKIITSLISCTNNPRNITMSTFKAPCAEMKIELKDNGQAGISFWRNVNWVAQISGLLFGIIGYAAGLLYKKHKIGPISNRGWTNEKLKIASKEMLKLISEIETLGNLKPKENDDLTPDRARFLRTMSKVSLELIKDMGLALRSHVVYGTQRIGSDLS